MAPPRCAISDATDGARVRVAGMVEVVVPVTAPLSGRSCGYAEVYEAHEPQPVERVGERLQLRDDSGVAEVELTHVESELLGQVRKAKVEAIDAELSTVEKHLVELKAQRRTASGPEAATLHREQKLMRRIATVLYAMRAQARGRSHGKRSLRDQAVFIQKECAALRIAGEGSQVRGLAIETEKLEAIVAEGDTIEVEGLARWRAGRAAGGYREAGRRLVLSGSADAPLRLSLTATERSERIEAGAVAPEDVRGRAKASRSRPPTQPKGIRSSIGWWLAALVLGMVSYYLLR